MPNAQKQVSSISLRQRNLWGIQWEFIRFWCAEDFWLITGNFQKLLSYFKMCTLTFSILFQHQPCVSGEISTRWGVSNRKGMEPGVWSRISSAWTAVPLGPEPQIGSCLGTKPIFPMSFMVFLHLNAFDKYIDILLYIQIHIDIHWYIRYQIMHIIASDSVYSLYVLHF